MSQQTQQYYRFGVVFPKETIERIERVKGKWISRNKFLIKSVTEAMDRIEAEQLNDNDDDDLSGVRGQVTSHAPTTPSPSPEPSPDTKRDDYNNV